MYLILVIIERYHIVQHLKYLWIWWHVDLCFYQTHSWFIGIGDKPEFDDRAYYD